MIKRFIEYKKLFKHSNFQQAIKRKFSQIANMCSISVKVLYTKVKALNNLVKNKDFVIQKAGKGNNIVILNRSDYISKPTKVLEDTPKFKRVNIIL